MTPDRPYPSLWRGLCSGDANLVLRFGTSIAVGVLLVGLAILGAVARGVARNYRTTEEAIMLALLLACLAWFGALWPIWRSARHVRSVVWPIIGTLLVGLLTTLACVVVEELLRHNEDLVMGGLALCGGALVIFLWLPTLHGLIWGRSVIGVDNQVDVHCPSCGYSMIGLRELRCPECGTHFTIDELIRAQHYARSAQRIDAISSVQTEPGAAEPQHHAES